MARKESSLEGYILAECVRIIADPNESSARKKLAAQWHDKLLNSINGWGNDGKTMAEAAGIEVPPNAPGGQKVIPGEGKGYSKNEEALGRQRQDYEGGPLSSEIDRRYRTGH